MSIRRLSGQTVEAYQIGHLLIDRSVRCRKQEIYSMSTDKEKSQQKFAKDELEEDRNIWRTDSTDLEDDSIIERNALEIAQGADRLAWVAVWVSVFAVVISVVGAAIGLSWQ